MHEHPQSKYGLSRSSVARYSYSFHPLYFLQATVVCRVPREKTLTRGRFARADELFAGNRLKRVDRSFTFTPRFARRKLLAVRSFVFREVVRAIAGPAERRAA